VARAHRRTGAEGSPQLGSRLLDCNGSGRCCHLSSAAVGNSLVGVPFLTFFPAIVLAAYIGGLGPSVLATALSAIAAWVILIPPYWSLAISSGSDILALVLFLFISLILCLVIFGFQIAVSRLREIRANEQEAASKLEHRVKQRTDELQASEARLRAIFETSYIYQGLMTRDGVLIDANATSLTGIKSSPRGCCRKALLGHPVVHRNTWHAQNRARSGSCCRGR
jgi:hypothetical protein